MSVRRFLFLVSFLFLEQTLIAQTCGYTSLLYHNPALLVAYHPTQHFKQKTESNSVVYTIPVVFHILHHTAHQNLADSIIQNQLAILNHCFLDCENTVRSEFESVFGCAGIRFVLASKSPTAEASSGINRVFTTKTSFNTGDNLFLYDQPKFSKYGGTDAWDTEKYLNIWICNLSPTSPSAGLLNGYAFPPVLANGWNGSFYVSPERQGVVLHYELVGDNNPSRKSYGSKILVHEIGHFLGLKHTWGDNENDCDSDDGLDDTPLCSSPSYSCNYAKNTCTQPNDLPDMVENYMDYAPAACMQLFTKQQVSRMLSNLIYLRPNLFQVESAISKENKVKIFPNPANSFVYVSLPKLNGIALADLFLYDVTGKLVLQNSIASGQELIKLPLDNLRKGVYYVVVKMGSSAQTLKLVVYD